MKESLKDRVGYLEKSVRRLEEKIIGIVYVQQLSFGRYVNDDEDYGSNRSWEKILKIVNRVDGFTEVALSGGIYSPNMHVWVKNENIVLKEAIWDNLKKKIEAKYNKPKK